MKVRVNDIAEKFATLGGIDKKDILRWYPLCLKCLRELQSVLKDGIENPDDLVRIEDATAVLAFYHYVLVTNARESKSFSAGDVSVTHNDKACEYAEKLWLDTKNSISDLISDELFSFCSVRYRG